MPIVVAFRHCQRWAATKTGLFCQVPIDQDQLLKKLDVDKVGVAHCGQSEVVRNRRLPQKECLFKFLAGRGSSRRPARYLIKIPSKPIRLDEHTQSMNILIRSFSAEKIRGEYIIRYFLHRGSNFMVTLIIIMLSVGG
jgi:hypothetical protein